MHVEVGAQIGLLLGHRLEQQSLLRREVAVDGPECDVGGSGDVAHLDRVEPALGRELERRIEHPATPSGLAARQRALRGRFGVGLGDDHVRNWNTF